MDMSLKFCNFALTNNIDYEKNNLNILRNYVSDTNILQQR